MRCNITLSVDYGQLFLIRKAMNHSIESISSLLEQDKTIDTNTRVALLEDKEDLNCMVVEINRLNIFDDNFDNETVEEVKKEG